MIVHVAAGSVGFLSGAAALSARKGGSLHRRSGTVFFVSMLVMATTAAYLSIERQSGTLFGSLVTFYLVATAWATVRRPEASTGFFEKAAFAGALACGTGAVMFAVQAANSPTHQFEGYSAPVYYFFAGLAALAGALDLKVILRGGISGASRIARHLWRMCTALFFATGSFFGNGLPKLLPAPMHVTPIFLVPMVVPLGLMLYWLIRIRLAGWLKTSAIGA